MFAEYYRPEYEHRSTVVVSSSDHGDACGPRWYQCEVPFAWVLVAFLFGMVLGMAMMRWQHRS
jgi:hypothetical protein